jgi:hypothetical protein
VPGAHGIDDARHPGVGDDDVCRAHERPHLVRQEPLVPLHRWPGGHARGVPVLDDELLVTRDRQRDADEPVERLVMGPEGGEDQ